MDHKIAIYYLLSTGLFERPAGVTAIEVRSEMGKSLKALVRAMSSTYLKQKLSCIYTVVRIRFEWGFTV